MRRQIRIIFPCLRRQRAEWRVRHAVVCGGCGRGNAGLCGAARPRLAPHPWVASARPAGKRPGAFPRPPFAASARKINVYIAFLHFGDLRSAAAVRDTATASLAALMLGCTRLFVPSPPRRLGESLARPLRARGLPARTDRVRAADGLGCYHRVRVQAFAVIPCSRFSPYQSVSIRTHPFLPRFVLLFGGPRSRQRRPTAPTSPFFFFFCGAN